MCEFTQTDISKVIAANYFKAEFMPSNNVFGIFRCGLCKL